MTGRLLKEAEIARQQQEHAKRIEHGCTVADLEALIAAGKRFPVIYADPSWPFDTWGAESESSIPARTTTRTHLMRSSALPVAAAGG